MFRIIFISAYAIINIDINNKYCIFDIIFEIVVEKLTLAINAKKSADRL